MTSSTSLVGSVSVSSDYGTTYEGYRAFDGIPGNPGQVVDTSWWRCGNGIFNSTTGQCDSTLTKFNDEKKRQWLVFEFTNAYTVKEITLRPPGTTTDTGLTCRNYDFYTSITGIDGEWTLVGGERLIDNPGPGIDTTTTLTTTTGKFVGVDVLSIFGGGRGILDTQCAIAEIFIKGY